MTEDMYKALAAFLGGAVALLTPIVPLLWVCLVFILVDGISAWQLNKRVIKQAKKKGEVIPEDAGKFRTSKAYKMIISMRDITALLFLGHILDTQVFGFFNGLYVANYLAGVFCVLQAWSILENASSANGSTWAKILQKIMVDKTERHLDINLSKLKDKENE